MRKSDAWTIANKVPSKELMYRAGTAIYEAAAWKVPVAILCGKGNNAGDINRGFNGDTGLGTTYVKSDLTVSIGTFKHGHFRGLADEAMKEKVNCDIGIEIRES